MGTGCEPVALPLRGDEGEGQNVERGFEERWAGRGGLLHRRRTGWGGRPPPPSQTKVTVVGEKEIYNQENLVGPLLVHNHLGPRPPPPLPPPSNTSLGLCHKGQGSLPVEGGGGTRGWRRFAGGSVRLGAFCCLLWRRAPTRRAVSTASRTTGKQARCAGPASGVPLSNGPKGTEVPRRPRIRRITRCTPGGGQ